ncbi:hypothetical protein [Zwartia sp.]|uniref:hypothetical protein n=1 Tax=Zwartia sp. TaxID=2978004 RepID=UPI003BB1CD0A
MANTNYHRQSTNLPDVVTSVDLGSDSEGLHLNDARLSVCLDAVYELDTLARLLPVQMNCNNEDDFHNARLVVRSLAGRMLRLTSVLLSGLGDEHYSTDELEKIIHLTGASQG